jgi:elongation factor P
MYSVSDFRTGLKLEYEGEPYIVVDFQHVKPGKGNAFTRTKLKSLLSGRTIQPTFKSGEVLQYLYNDGEQYTFMDTTSYDQVGIQKEVIGDQVAWLQENSTCAVLFWKGKTIAVTLPTFVVLKITQCEPGVRGDTATNAGKPATLESGGTVSVPLFINEGERIKIDTRTGQYVERVNY